MATDNKTILEKVKMRVQRSPDSVFLRREFNDLGGSTQVGLALKKLVENETLIRVGYGIYVRTYVSKYTDKRLPEKSLPEVAKTVLAKLGYEVGMTKAELDYNNRLSTQVPTGRVIAVKGRFSRNLQYNGYSIHYEKCP